MAATASVLDPPIRPSANDLIADISDHAYVNARGGAILLHKDDAEHLVPEELHSVFRQIADAFAAGNFRLHDHPVDGVEPIDPETAGRIADNICAYGDPLAPLNAQTWGQSIYRWMEGYWQVLVDLTTRSEPVSDLTLHAKLSEIGENYAVVVESVHVQ